MAKHKTGGIADSGIVNITTAGRRRTDFASLNEVGDIELINYSGKQGFFTPLVDENKPNESEKNLEKILLAMKEQLKLVQLENLDLRMQLDADRKKNHRSPDDFATAVSHSLDSLQTRLHEMKNPVSRFAIKAFDVEFTVSVEVTEMGTIDYRFITPEEDIDPSRLSKIKMSVVPLPKDTSAGTWKTPDFTPMTDVEEIQGIGETYQKTLNRNGIYTLSDLLTAGTRVRSKIELSKMLGVDRQRLSEWLSHAELMTIKGIDGRAAEVLANIGITSLEKLAKQNPEELLTAYNAEVERMGHASVRPVTQSQLETWINSARVYIGVD